MITQPRNEPHQIGMRNVLISEPSSDPLVPFLPYQWAALKTWWRNNAQRLDAYDWLPPIYDRASFHELMRPVQGRKVDVLGLSCYVWNWDLQCQIAEAIKRDNPSCLVVAGGPHVDYTKSDFFHRHPYIDCVVVKDGEIPFTQILDHRADSNSSDLTGIKGLYVPHAETRQPFYTGDPDSLRDFSISPYIAESDYFAEVVTNLGNRGFGAVLETNRGCPYGCSFCDWGSATMSKVRRFPMDRVHHEVEWLINQGPEFVFLADANFGIFPRDVELAKWMSDLQLRQQASGKKSFKQFFYSAAKNHPERNVEIAEALTTGGIRDVHTVSIQHTHPTVLAATDRSNISVDKQREQAQAMMAKQIPLEVQFITGIPGDTCELWRESLCTVMEWGIHEAFIVYMYQLLPNAPASNPAFLEKWQVRTIDRMIDGGRGHTPIGETDGMEMAKIIVGSSTYSEEDWGRMQFEASLIRCMHGFAFTRLIALYLQFTHRIGYLDFYSRLIDRLPEQSRLMSELREAVLETHRRFIAEPDAYCDMVLPESRYYLSATRWICLRLIDRFDEFFSDLTRFLQQEFPEIENLPSLVSYQRDMLIRPSYDRRVGKEFAVSHRWDEYFDRIGKSALGPQVPEPERGEFLVRITEQKRPDRRGASEYAWSDAPEDERITQWFEVLIRNASASLTTSALLFQVATWQLLDHVSASVKEEL